MTDKTPEWTMNAIPKKRGWYWFFTLINGPDAGGIRIRDDFHLLPIMVEVGETKVWYGTSEFDVEGLPFMLFVGPVSLPTPSPEVQTRLMQEIKDMATPA